MINLKRALRILLLLILVGLLALVLTSCKLPASKGPQAGSQSTAEFPLPGQTQQTSPIDVSALATQTAQARPAEVVPTQPSVETETPTEVSPYPLPTDVPVVPTEPAATATPIEYVQPTQGSIPATYTLEEGEYVFCIARRFDVNVSELLELNNLAPDTLVGPGLELQIPQTGNPFEGDRVLQDHPTTYTVEEGDTLGSIACSFGDVSPELIMQQNHMSSPDLTPGTELVIP
ncbi:MAG: LysM peptidoglycan-binding domain-containing protein [Acidobacteriaceae bacterium]